MFSVQVRLQNIPAFKQTTSPLNRTQRKKCDEGKPICLRCARSGKRCESFADYASPLSAAKKQHLSSPCRPLSSHLKTDPAQSRFAKLGFEILAQQACQDAFGIDANVWTCLLPQLSSINATINAAIASLGATYEAVVLRPVHSIGLGDSLAAIQYHKALASLRLDVLLQSHGPIPPFLASLLLAIVEVLWRHFGNALMHLHGAFTIMTECIYRSAQSRSASSTVLAPDEAENSATVDDSRTLYLMAQALDVQTATYALSRKPQLPSSLFASNRSALGMLSDSFSPNQAWTELIPLLHACYHYTSLASRYKYLPRSDLPSHVTLDQSRYIALLSHWVSKLSRRTSTSTEHDLWSDQYTLSNCPGYALLVQRIQCISAIIYLSTILNYKERSYDAFTSFFEQITTDATILLENQSPGGCLTSPQNRFRIISPISQPLYLTAMKCRQGTIRRRAIHLLGLTGREGPWHGAVFQKVAQRVMEIEEDQVLQRGALLLEEDIDKIPVTENMRLHGSGIDFNGERLPEKGFIEAQFSRCVDAELMVTSSRVSWESMENWEIWTERIAI
jgi:hypothetical protein